MIDDRVELVRSLGADGVHLGANDMPVEEARKLLGPAFIIGATANTPEQALAGARAGADYLGVGPFRFTRTKDNLAPLLGAEGIGEIVRKLREAGSDIPVCAIGGITPDDVLALEAAGADAIAVSGAILQSPDPVAAMRRFLGEE